MIQKNSFPYLVQIKRKSVTPYLHFEVGFKKKLKTETKRRIEIAFHIEFAKAHLKDKRGLKRKAKLQRLVHKEKQALIKQGLDFKYQRKWGKRWVRLYSIYETPGLELDDESLNEVLRRLLILVVCLKPKLDQANWGRGREVEVEDL